MNGAPVYYYENGIGEERAILVQSGRIIEARIARHGGVKCGLVTDAIFTKQLVAHKRGIAALGNGAEILLSPIPKSLTEGQTLRLVITREAIDERTRHKLPIAKAAPNSMPMDAPTLLDHITGQGVPIIPCHAHGPDHFEEFGWSEVMDEARTGMIAFQGGGLLIAVTPAMTLIDIDGDMPAFALSMAAAKVAAQAIRRLDLQGSIGIDFLSLDKSERQAVSAAFDEAMVGPFERTAINGFGLLHLVTRRQRPSLCELWQSKPILSHALALLRIAERHRGAGEMVITAHPAILKKIESHGDWMAELSKRTGRNVRLASDEKLSMGAGYVA